MSRVYLSKSRVSILAGAFALTLGSVATPALAQEEAADELSEIVVTGSRIRKPELASTTPVLALSEESLATQGLRNMADIAAQLPQFAPSFGASRTQSTFSGAATSGLNLANLRNLAAVRTVVLINGRRVPGGSSTSTNVDFNTLPTANIERVELLTGGASAVYGADAVAGVVNIITKQNFEGVELGANYGITSDSDNKSPGGYVMIGGAFGEDRGHGLLTVEYQEQGKVSCVDRYLCSQDFAWLSPATQLRGPAAYSAVGAAAKFQAGTTGVFYTSRNGSYTDAGGALIPFSTPIDGYNRNADRTLAIPTDRLMVAAQGDYSLGAGTKAFVELNFGRSETNAPFEGHPFQSTAAGSLFGGGPGVAGLQPSMPITNPFVPTALYNQAITNGVNPVTGVLNWQQRFNQFDERGATNTRETVRAVAGFKGDLSALGGRLADWTWEVSHVYGSTSLQSATDGLVGTDRLYYSLRVEQTPGAPAGTYRCVDPGARAAGCIPVNPFAPYTQAMKDYLKVRAGQRGTSNIEDSQAFVSGTIFNLPAGGVSAALGVERRSFSGFLDYDEVINRALTTGNQIGDVDKIKTVTKEAFSELSVPVLKDLPFARSLTLDGAYRYSKPERGDSYNTWSYGLNWEPVNGLRIRAANARSARSPVPGELSGVGQTFGVVNDPCTASRRNANPTRAANCLADGVPANYAPPLNVEQSVGGFVGGNPNLTEETGDTLTYGFVVTPSFMPNFSLTVDRFDIEVTDVINTVGRGTKVNLCYDTVDRQFCGDLTRGVNPNTPGNWALISVNDQLINVAAYRVKGLDIETNYAFDIGQLFNTEREYGRISLRAVMTIYDEAVQQLAGGTTVDLLGFAGGSTSDQGWIKRQGVADIGYRVGPFAANWHTRYVGPAGMAEFADGFPEIGSHFYHDLRLSYAFGEGSDVYLGVTNLTDKQPPFFASGTSGTQALDTIPAYYDVFGRSYFGGVRIKF
jgi:outer membrane receptor protein involved in Fe transport